MPRRFMKVSQCPDEVSKLPINNTNSFCTALHFTFTNKSSTTNYMKTKPVTNYNENQRHYNANTDSTLHKDLIVNIYSHVKAKNGRDEEVDSGPENSLTSLLYFHSSAMNSLQQVSTNSLVITVCHFTFSLSEQPSNINKYQVIYINQYQK